MADDRASPSGAAPENPEDQASLGNSFARLSRAAKDFGAAEVALAKRRGVIVAGAAQSIAIFGAFALIIAFAMIVTLMIGAVMALAPYWGLGLSLLAVTGAALIAIILCALGIKAAVGRIKEGLR